MTTEKSWIQSVNSQTGCFVYHLYTTAYTTGISISCGVSFYRYQRERVPSGVLNFSVLPYLILFKIDLDLYAVLGGGMCRMPYSDAQWRTITKQLYQSNHKQLIMYENLLDKQRKHIICNEVK